MQGRSSFDRRALLKALAAAGLLSGAGASRAADAPPETKRIRIAHTRGGTCWAPQYVAEEMLRAEGFSEVRYVPVPGSEEVYPRLAAGDLDISIAFSAPFIMRTDAGAPIVLLAGIHPGCIELYGSERIRTLRDLKGRRASVTALNSAPHAFIASMMAHVGMNPQRDIEWVIERDRDKAVDALAKGSIDALLASPPFSYQMRKKGIGRVIVDMTADRPWSQYFCCVLAGNRDFVRKNPAATKRAMRAILKGADLCSAEPEASAKVLSGSTFGYDRNDMLQTLRELSYGRWRELDAEDTVRFYALRLHEAGLIKSNAKKILAEATDLRFLRELKNELKA